KTESPGARYTIGWAVKNRAFEALTPKCDSYPGAEGGALTTTCRNDSTMPCGDPNFCTQSKQVCCAVHGGTSFNNPIQSQWSDTHISFNNLLFRGTIYAAWYVLDGLVPDPSTGWIPPNVSNCSFACGSVNNMQPSGGPWCSSGSNLFTPDPN